MTSELIIPRDIHPIAYRMAYEDNAMFAESLDDALKEGRSRSACVAVIEDCFDTAIEIALETPPSVGVYGEDGNIGLLRYLAEFTVEEFVNSGDMRSAAEAIVDANKDRNRPKTQKGTSSRGYIKTGNAANRANARARGIKPKSKSTRSAKPKTKPGAPVKKGRC